MSTIKPLKDPGTFEESGVFDTRKSAFFAPRNFLMKTSSELATIAFRMGKISGCSHLAKVAVTFFPNDRTTKGCFRLRSERSHGDESNWEPPTDR